jgi:CheY-like chemotaxis protein
VSADRGQLERVLVNLAVNGRDAMPGGGVLTIETSTVDIAIDDRRHVRLAVSDTGTGMTDAVIERAFEPFFTTKAEGTGLGLATVHSIINKAGGHAQIHSEPWVGTTIAVLLPVAGEIASAQPHGHGTILAVEKEDAIRGVIRRILVVGGYDVLVAASGAEALNVAADHEGDIALLITDVMTPGMLGKKLASTLLTIRPGTAVLYTSDFPQSIVGHSQAIGPDDAVIEKPYSTASLLAAVHKLLDA